MIIFSLLLANKLLLTQNTLGKQKLYFIKKELKRF